MVQLDGRTSADLYAARVEAVEAQRTRLRGPRPPGDLFAALPPDHPLLSSDPRRPLDPNLEVLAAYLEPSDAVVDVGGGSGRISLPLALRCREVINVEPSAAMAAAFAANAARADIANVRAVAADWPAAEPPQGTVALVNHVTYFVRDIVPFIEQLEQAGPRRVIITVNSPPPPSWNRRLYQLVHGEAEEVVPGHVELVNVLWDQGILPDIHVLPVPPPGAAMPAPSRDAAVAGAVARFGGDQWAFWPLGPELERRLRELLDTRFDELFVAGGGGFLPRWVTPGRELLITWRPGADRQAS
jgi:SAM-dependent methyltransferase